jgi:patatin-like phospholipase/acyl hydrolase
MASGGVRGIVELEILKLIQDKLPSPIPIRSFFDLVVGTRYLFKVEENLLEHY